MGLLSVFLGSGTQILSMAGITLVFACLGFLSPANRGALMTCALVLVVCLGTPAGYVSARIYKSFGGEKWKSNVLLTSMLCPGIVFAHFFILVALLVLWFGVSVPLTFVGAYFGFRKAPIEQPVRTNQIPRQIPDQSVYTQPIPGIIMGGVLPFGCIFIQLFFVLNSIWSSQIYYMYGFLFLVFVILIITCSETTILLCYFHLCAEDYHWWWRSLTSGFTAFSLQSIVSTTSSPSCTLWVVLLHSSISATPPSWCSAFSSSQVQSAFLPASGLFARSTVWSRLTEEHFARGRALMPHQIFLSHLFSSYFSPAPEQIFLTS